MSLMVKSAGAWVTPTDVYVKNAGAWTAVQEVFVKNGDAWVSVYQAEVTAVLATRSTSVDVSSLFDATTWSSAKRKRVVVPAGVTVNANDWRGALFVPATAAGWGGELIIDIAGNLYGIGGVALSNAGEGGAGVGSAITGATGQRVTVNLLSGGLVHAGGGAGGLGGTGGAGSYTAVASDETRYTGTSIWTDNGSVSVAYWDNVDRWIGAGGEAGPVTGNDGATYYRGSLQMTDWEAGSYYSIRRVTYTTVGTTGGAGGYGGRGQGADGAAASGSTGSAGGTNAGTGGTGGAGAAWGAQGGTGSTGAAGNAGAGAAGAAGGLGGRWAWGYCTINTNAGTTAGRLVLA